MKKNRISVSFVGVFDNILSMIPQLDGEFCKKLFQAPYDTVSGLSPEGFIIRVNNRPFPAIIINPQKVVFIAENNELLYNYINAIKKKFEEINFNTKFSAFGLNYEYEWTELKDNSSLWLWNYFITSNINIGNEYHVCNKLSLRLGVNDNEYVNVDIEPRAGMSNGVFASINHHHNYPLEVLPDKEKLFKFLEDSTVILETDYFPKLIEREDL